MIEKKFEEEFRSCVCKFDSMAIAETISPKQMQDYIYMIVEDTNETDSFFEDLFELGRLFEMVTNLPY